MPWWYWWQVHLMIEKATGVSQISIHEFKYGHHGQLLLQHPKFRDLPRLLSNSAAATSIFGLPCSFRIPTRTPQLPWYSRLSMWCKSMPPYLALCYLVSTLSHTPPLDTRLPHVGTAHPAVVEYRVGLFRFRRPNWTLVAVYFRISRWIFVQQIWQLRHCHFRCGPVELLLPLTHVLRNFRELLSAYVVRIKPSLEDCIPICLS